MTAVRRQFARIWAWLFGSPVASDAPEEQTDWCLVGNVVGEHAFGTAKEIRRGTKHFTPGTEVYCLPSQWGDGYEKIVVVGICRKSRRWITVVVPSKNITNWRAKVVYKPVVLQRLREGFNGFRRQWESQGSVEQMAEWLLQRDEQTQ